MGSSYFRDFVLAQKLVSLPGLVVGVVGQRLRALGLRVLGLFRV